MVYKLKKYSSLDLNSTLTWGFKPVVEIEGKLYLDYTHTDEVNTSKNFIGSVTTLVVGLTKAQWLVNVSELEEVIDPKIIQLFQF